MTDRPYRMQVGPEEISKRFLALCRQIDFGSVEVEIANGLPKDIKVKHQSFRIDLTNPDSGGTVKVIKPDSSHAGESE